MALWQLRKLFPIPALQRHGYLVAKSGAGKSELLKLLLLRLKLRFTLRGWGIDSRRTVFLIDPHGEVAEQFARNKAFSLDFERSTRKGELSNLVYIAPYLEHGYMPTLNPFDLGGERFSNAEIGKMAQELSSAFSIMLSRGEVSLSLPMKTLLSAMFTVLLTIARNNPQNPPTFFDVRRFLDDNSNDDLIKFGMNHPEESIADFFRLTFHDPRFGGTKFSLSVKLSNLLNSPMFVLILCQPRSSWSPGQLFRSGKTVIINASKSILGTEVCEIFGRTITALLQMAAFRRGVPEFPHPTFLILDEASNFVSTALGGILAELRKFGLHLILANQIVGQGNMTQELKDGILGNTCVRVLGMAGNSSRRQMAAECEVSREDTENFRVGQFLVQVEGRNPVRVTLPRFWLDWKRTIPAGKQWEAMKHDQIERYYFKIPTTTETPILPTSQLQEDIEAGAVRVNPHRGWKPRFGVRPLVSIT